MLIVYLITALAQIRLRRHLETTAPERLGVRMWLFPASSYITVAAMVAVLVAMIITPARAIEAWSSLVVVAVVLALYAAFRMGRGGRVEI